MAGIMHVFVDSTELCLPLAVVLGLDGVDDALDGQGAYVVLDVLRPVGQLGWVLQEGVDQHRLVLLLHVLEELLRERICPAVVDFELNVNRWNAQALAMLRRISLIQEGGFHR